MLASNPTDIDSNSVSSLDYWVRRATDKRSKSRGESHYVYQGVRLVVHPKRAAMIEQGDRVLWVGVDSGVYKGRGWFEKFLADIETAVSNVKSGGGETKEPSLGDKLRAEILLREAGTPTTPSLWWHFLRDDELELCLGCWMHRVGVMSLKYEITRNATLDFQPTNDEFELGARSCQSHVLWEVFKRLGNARSELAEVSS